MSKYCVYHADSDYPLRRIVAMNSIDSGFDVQVFTCLQRLVVAAALGHVFTVSLGHLQSDPYSHRMTAHDIIGHFLGALTEIISD